jgi:hypothetical protein
MVAAGFTASIAAIAPKPPINGSTALCCSEIPRTSAADAKTSTCTLGDWSTICLHHERYGFVVTTDITDVVAHHVRRR